MKQTVLEVGPTIPVLALYFIPVDAGIQRMGRYLDSSVSRNDAWVGFSGGPRDKS